MYNRFLVLEKSDRVSIKHIVPTSSGKKPVTLYFKISWRIYTHTLDIHIVRSLCWYFIMFRYYRVYNIHQALIFYTKNTIYAYTCNAFMFYYKCYTTIKIIWSTPMAVYQCTCVLYMNVQWLLCGSHTVGNVLNVKLKSYIII